MQQMIFIADFIACSTCFGQYYAHHQELESIIQMVAACGIMCFGFQVVGMVWSWRLCVRSAACKPAECVSKWHKTFNFCNGDYCVSCDVELWILSVVFSNFGDQRVQVYRKVPYHNEFPQNMIICYGVVRISISLRPFQISEFLIRLFAILQS